MGNLWDLSSYDIQMIAMIADLLSKLGRFIDGSFQQNQ